MDLYKSLVTLQWQLTEYQIPIETSNKMSKKELLVYKNIIEEDNAKKNSA